MANKDEELNKQLKQIEKLTAEQLLGGLRAWLGGGKEDPKYTLPKSNQESQPKKK
jgi:hypothetical protein